MRLVRELRAHAALLVGCIAAALVGALMWGPQHGTPEDYGAGVAQAVLRPRVVVFLALGVLAYVGIRNRARISARLRGPGAPLLLAALGGVLGSMLLLHWLDTIGDAKFGAAGSAAQGLDGLAAVYFGWLAWVLLAVAAAAGALVLVTRSRIAAAAAAVTCVVAAVLTVVAHAGLVAGTGAIDHSHGAWVCAGSYLVGACGGVVAGWAPDGFSVRALGQHLERRWPGALLATAGFAVVTAAIAWAAWFSPLRLNAGLAQAYPLFAGTGISPLAAAFQTYLFWVLLALLAGSAGWGYRTRSRPLLLASAILAVLGACGALFTAHEMGQIGAALGVDGATTAWQNLGVGPWYAIFGFAVIAIGTLTGAVARPPAAAPDTLVGRISSRPTMLAAGLTAAVVLPLTLTTYWQQVLVSQVGVYVLLAVGLNVVVGWAGLLDLGFIAFYAIGSYVTAYLVGALPVQPPDFLLLTPLEAIPFAIAACLVAGVALGAPTLRLRGDYLAIVTLGFGEIIRIVAVNDPGGFTNSTRGPVRPVPHPSIDIGPLHLTWDNAPLPYWYLLLALLGVVVLIFRRLESSPVGRAWAAIREDEIAARACGVDPTRVKLLAFAIGASTSGLAGVFFASQVGYFNPDNFVLNNSILLLAYVVFGGMGSMTAVVAGAAVLTWLPEFLKDQVPADDRQMWIGAVLLLMMIFRPAGLFARRTRAAPKEPERAAAAPLLATTGARA